MRQSNIINIWVFLCTFCEILKQWNKWVWRSFINLSYHKFVQASRYRAWLWMGKHQQRSRDCVHTRSTPSPLEATPVIAGQGLNLTSSKPGLFPAVSSSPQVMSLIPSVASLLSHESFVFKSKYHLFKFQVLSLQVKRLIIGSLNSSKSWVVSL